MSEADNQRRITQLESQVSGLQTQTTNLLKKSLVKGGTQAQVATLQAQVASLQSQVKTPAPPPPSGGDFTTQNVVTGSRNITGAVYQNTTGNTMFVAVFISGASGGISAFSDSNSSPSTGIAETAGDSMYFMVLNNNYYRVAAAPGTLLLWVEWY